MIEKRQQNLDEELVRIQVRQNASMCFFDDEDVQARTRKAYPDLKVNFISLNVFVSQLYLSGFL